MCLCGRGRCEHVLLFSWQYLCVSALPAGHGSGVEAPSAQNEPGVQPRQAVAPVSFWNVPLLQVVHAAFPVTFAAVPIGHGIGNVSVLRTPSRQ